LLGLKILVRRRTWAGIHLPIGCGSCTVSADCEYKHIRIKVQYRSTMMLWSFISGEFSGMAISVPPYRRNSRMHSFRYWERLNHNFFFPYKPLLCVLYNLYRAFAKRLGKRTIPCHTLPLEACLSVCVCVCVCARARVTREREREKETEREKAI